MKNSNVLLKTLNVWLLCCATGCTSSNFAQDQYLQFEGGKGPGAGKNIVFLAGDEEYRSEEGLPMLAKMLSAHLGFSCIVLFSQDEETGLVNPDNSNYVPGMEWLEQADLVVIQFRFRELPDKDMKYFVDYVESGHPLIGIRTATHAFNYGNNSESEYSSWDWRSKDPVGGFGKSVLGETWVAHHGHHGQEATRGVLNHENKLHPILNGVEDVFGTTDVYAVRQLPKDASVLMWGGVLEGMDEQSKLIAGPKNNPMHPIAWTREIKREGVDRQRIFVTTMGASQDWLSHDLRKMFANAALWAIGNEAAISNDGAPAVIVGEYAPTPFGFGKYQKNMRPNDFAK